MELVIENYGLIHPFSEWQKKQEEYWAKRVAGITLDRLVLMEHEPIYTAGVRCAIDSSKIDECFNVPRRELPCEIITANRGGLVTYQGPGIFSVYCIFKAKNETNDWEHAEWLHEILHSAASRFFESYEVDVFTLGSGEKRGPRGLFVHPNKKIASVGFQIEKHVSKYGLTVSMDPDEHYLEPLIPCGLKGFKMTSLHKESGLRKKFSLEEKEEMKTKLIAEICARI